MAIFDQLSFNPQGYGGQGGGLLDLLRSLQMQQQYQPAPAQQQGGPAASFDNRFDAAYDTPSAYKQIGDYRMPQFGPRELYQPEQAALPPNAQPAQGQMPQQQPAPQMQQPMQQPAALPPALSQQTPSGLGGAFRGFAQNAHTGPIGALIGAIGGGMGMTDPNKDIQRQNLRAQFEAYKAAGLSPEKALLAVMNPEAGKAFLPQIATKTEKMSPGETLVSVTGTKATPISGLPAPQAKFDDVASIRKEVGALPEVKRFAEAAPIFASMTKSMNNPTAAADLDFVYGVAKIFDPESVVREGEMKLVGQAQSIPEGIKGMMQRVVYGGERLSQEARFRILQVAQTRIKELEGATNQRLAPYPDIAKRNNMRSEDIMPQLPTLPTIPPIEKKGGPQTQSIQGYRIHSVR